MTPKVHKPTLEDVLNEFSVAPAHDRHTLERYVRQYPQYAVEITELFHELSKPIQEASSLSPTDRAAVDAAWVKHSKALSPSPVDLFAGFSVPQLREIAGKLGVPRQIITAFSEHQVVASSIPSRFLANVAKVLKKTVEEVRAAQASCGNVAFARSHKADGKPKASEQVTFEKLLIDAGVPEEQRAKLMAEED
jgi:hypothetical protein